MESKNECPFCGSDQLYTRLSGDRHVHYCFICGADGPARFLADDAIHAFTHPAHLMQALHTYDPVTEIKIKRETGDNYRDILLNVYNVRDRLDFDEISDDLTDLTAALEVGK